MADDVIGVESYQRRTKSGKVINVRQYTQRRDIADLLKAPGRAPMAAAPGQYPNERSLPMTPVVAAAMARVSAAKVETAEIRLEATQKAQEDAQKAQEDAERAAQEEQAAGEQDETTVAVQADEQAAADQAAAEQAAVTQAEEQAAADEAELDAPLPVEEAQGMFAEAIRAAQSDERLSSEQRLQAMERLLALTLRASAAPDSLTRRLVLEMLAQAGSA